MPSRKRKTCSRICQLKFSLTGKKKTEQHKLNMRYANAWKYTKEILIDYIKGDAILWIAKKYKSDKRTIRQVLKEQGIGVFRGRKGIQAWNKGLNQFIDKRVAKWAGENNPNWKGGITPLMMKIRRCAKYREWVKKIFKKDNWTCQICKKKGGELEADHYPKKFSEIITENKINSFEKAIKCKKLWNAEGRTLCIEDHNKTKKVQV